MKHGTLRWGRLFLALVLGLLSSFPAMAAKDAPLISVDTLKADLGKPGLTIIDVRSTQDWAESDKKIKAAVREDPKVIDWAKKYAKDRDIVLYCA